MKRWFLLALSSLLMSGCGSGVSTSQYESVVAERDQYKKQLESIQNPSNMNPEFKKQDAISEDGNISKEPRKIEIVDSGWSTSKPSDYAHVYYAVEIKNPNSDYAVEYPKVIITAKSEDGKILANDEQTLSSIAAGDTITYGNDISYEGPEADTVEISVSNGKDNYVKQNDADFTMSSSFSFSNTSKNPGTFTGEISNGSENDFDSTSVSVIYKLNGKMVGGEVTFISDLEAGQTKAFELSSSLEEGKYDAFEFFAIQW